MSAVTKWNLAITEGSKTYIDHSAQSNPLLTFITNGNKFNNNKNQHKTAVCGISRLSQKQNIDSL